MRTFFGELGHRWSGFLSIVLDPWALLLAAGVVAALVYGTSHDDKTVSAITAAIASLGAGFVGGIWTKRAKARQKPRSFANRWSRASGS
jgi:uncharacterized membrane protein YjjB (DUF3815 family)